MNLDKDSNSRTKGDLEDGRVGQGGAGEYGKVVDIESMTENLNTGLSLVFVCGAGCTATGYKGQ